MEVEVQSADVPEPAGFATAFATIKGEKLARPELFRLLSDAEPGDILLVEQLDGLSRLTDGDWQKLKAELAAKHIQSWRSTFRLRGS
jgi:DNA invertase Pin-like site-specific DNA recombinase